MADSQDDLRRILGYYGDAQDPFAEYPNPEAARASSRVGLVEKLIATLGLGGDKERRTKEPWSDALANTTGSQSLANMVYDLAHGIQGAKEYKPGTGDTSVGQAGASLMNAPVLGGFTATATGAMPKNALGSSFTKGPKVESAMPARKLDDLGLYSKAVEEAQKLQIKSGTPEQMLNALTKAGVKPEELYWMGLADHAGQGKVKPSQDLLNFIEASGSKGKLSKDDLVMLAEKRRVKPEKVERTGEGVDEDYMRERMAEAANEQQDRHEMKPDPEGIVDEMMDIEEDPKNKGRWRIVDRRAAEDMDEADIAAGRHVIEDDIPTRDKAYSSADEHAEEIAKETGRYSVYNQDGQRVDGPFESERRAERAVERADEEAWSHAYENLDASDFGDPNGAKHLEYLKNRPGGEEAGQNYRENVYSVPQEVLSRRGQEPFTQSHYPENGNVLAHWLLHDYTDAATNKGVTYANEGQSDWRKALTKYGERKSGPELEALEKQADEARAARKILNEQYYENPIRDPNMMDPISALKEKTALWDQIQALPGFPKDDSFRDQMHWASTHVPDIPNNLYQRWENAQHDAGLYGRRDTSDIPNYSYHKAPPDIVRMLEDANRDMYGGFKNYEAATRSGDPGWLHKAQQEFETAQKRHRELLAAYPGIEPEAVKAYKDQLAQTQLRETETSNAYDQARRGISAGPFVGDQAAANRFLAKQLLWESANDPNSAFASWVHPDRITERWGEKLRNTYEKAFPDTILKLAREHDPAAKIGNVHIGDYEGARNQHVWQGPEAQPPANEPFLPWSGPAGNGTKHEQYPGGLMAERSAPVVASHDVPIDIRAEYRNPMDREVANADPSIANLGYRLVTEAGPVGDVFRSRAAAEQALRDMQSGNTRPQPSLESVIQKYDLSAEPAIAMTDKMRESIKKKGFPLFVNPPTSSLASFLSNPSPTTSASILDREYGSEKN